MKRSCTPGLDEPGLCTGCDEDVQGLNENSCESGQLYDEFFFANNINVDIPGKLGRDTNTKERDVINSLNSLVVEVKLKFRLWVMYCRDDHGFDFLSIGLQEV